MKIIITGGQGFLGQRLAKALLSSDKVPITELVLIDVIAPAMPYDDGRITPVTLDLNQANTCDLEKIITKDTTAIFHLAAIVSSHAEQDPDLGYEINVKATKKLLDLCRKVNPNIRFIFSSSLAVYGGELPETILDDTALTPQSSYGSQKAMCELLINDYARKGFVDAVALRLPTICIRPGRPNQAASSFVSSIIREPLQGKEALCPVDKHLKLWISSPDVVVNNFIHCLTLPPLEKNKWHVINLPGISVSVESMLNDLVAMKGQAILEHIRFIFDEKINAIVASWPSRIDTTTALSLGFYQDENFRDVITQFMACDLSA
ncbi:D-erythronate dehydrogenase [Spirabiliibacterium falconis]|uniref:D-erythronate dehydrogenase n=1 Tax=Spirabiliibacterium falconis TaxID=572023 RepID=UPI001AAC8F1A|nr:D-erythronate dehydrogenase [Spirabiliibacterium falconis]MBE2894568.1 SDR family oxidoreductase [Spirabiliibacterium falconis]